ncbi:MAG: pyruvate kinase [Acidobacteriota bacterium]
MARTKIVCTLGPAAQTEACIEALALQGMDVGRLNFSHGTESDHARRCEILRKVSRRIGRPLAALQDLQGPKIRLGSFRDPVVHLEEGAPFTLTTKPCEGGASRAHTTYARLPKDVKKGDRIYLADGTLELHVERVTGSEVHTQVARGGPLRSHQGINLPGVQLSTPSLTAKDKRDLAVGLELGVDFVALSFVRRPGDVRALKALLGRSPHPPWIVAKIEKPEALDHLDGILSEVHGVMVARGDLGVELGLEKVPHAQKTIISEANRRGKFVITATQMLESMVDHPTPTRAEVSDVANAIFDGTDAVMLSGESAAGKYPVEAVSFLHRIAEEAERSPFYHPERQPFTGVADFHHAASHAAASAARDLGAAAVLSITPTGRMPRLLSKFHMACPVIACSAHEPVLRRLAVVWGVVPLRVEPAFDAEKAVTGALEAASRAGHIHAGQTVLVTLSMLAGESEITNVLKLHRV